MFIANILQQSESKRPPFALTMSSKRLVTKWHDSRAFFRAATLEWDIAGTSVSKMDQIAKSIGLMSGLEGGQMSLAITHLTLERPWAHF